MIGAKELLAETTKLARNCLTSPPVQTVIQMLQVNHGVVIMAKNDKNIKIDDEINE